MGRYKIVVETTNSKNMAQNQYNLINEHEMNVNITIYKTDDGELYCVEAGPYSNKKSILQDLDKIKDLGIINSFITNA